MKLKLDKGLFFLKVIIFSFVTACIFCVFSIYISGVVYDHQNGISNYSVREDDLGIAMFSYFFGLIGFIVSFFIGLFVWYAICKSGDKK